MQDIRLKEIGFRFFVSGMRGSKYGIKDLSDNITEFYSYDDVMDLSKRVKIQGVVDRTINLDWFQGYIRREWAFKSSVNDFVKKFGLCFSKCDSGRLYLKLCAILNGKDVRFDYSFYEFVNSMSIVYLADNNLIKEYTGTPSSLTGYICKIEREGVGLRYITDEVLLNFPFSLLGVVNFDNYCPNSSKIWIQSPICSDATINTHLHSSRPVNLSIYGMGSLSCKNISSDNGDIAFSMNIKSLFMSKSFADSVYFDFIGMNSFERVFTDDELVLTKLLKDSYNISSVPYCISDRLLSGAAGVRWRTCDVIGGVDAYLNSLNNFFVVLNNSDIHVSAHAKVLAQLEKEENFEERHNISWEKFRKLCRVVGKI